MDDERLETALAYLERVVETHGQNSGDHHECYDQTACHIADLLRKIARERDEARRLLADLVSALRLPGHHDETAQALGAGEIARRYGAEGG